MCTPSDATSGRVIITLLYIWPAKCFIFQGVTVTKHRIVLTTCFHDYPLPPFRGLLLPVPPRATRFRKKWEKEFQKKRNRPEPFILDSVDNSLDVSPGITRVMPSEICPLRAMYLGGGIEGRVSRAIYRTDNPPMFVVYVCKRYGKSPASRGGEAKRLIASDRGRGAIEKLVAAPIDPVYDFLCFIQRPQVLILLCTWPAVEKKKMLLCRDNILFSIWESWYSR